MSCSEAARALGAGDREIASWMGALGVGMGFTCIALSLRWRVPVVTAWSTPGAAMLVTGVAGVPMAEAIGAFAVCGALCAIAGFSGAFERAIARIPVGVAAGMLAGVLLRFGLGAFAALQTDFALVASMTVAWLAGRRWFPALRDPRGARRRRRGRRRAGDARARIDRRRRRAAGLDDADPLLGGGGRHRAAAVPRDHGVAERPRRGDAARIPATHRSRRSF